MTPRIIVTDMDGTLLNSEHEIPARFWPLLDEMHEQGIVFAPASGRQLYTLLDQFAQAGKDLSVIAENGTVVYHEGEIISVTTIDPEVAHRVIRTMAHSDLDWGVVVCRVDGAFIARGDVEFLTETVRYYAKLDVVDDLHSIVNDQVIKLAIYSFPDAETVAAPALAESVGDHTLAISGAHWIDIMSPHANKGVALQQLADNLGVPIEHTAAFGDYLNDYELLHTAGTAYAMSNAHPDIKYIADHVVGSNDEEAVLTTIHSLLTAAK
ncbi:Cof-type HAD-IIB family hydrolase [Corynebacterium diphtheriae]|uniref:Cof-type HAD-IIB family hydrolase n=1 Tax=Corynebacterium diphtheriae TaxID=1717 RepID=UPI0002468313|nr:Cof-type HAD-IIB family hydrolase [Corynebacterium diphtheriae]AEX78526.1 hypothetical protein CDHC03_0795 [Corynebacterium diphtheriae HC03]KJJ60839.1 HAD family hydrolase [Corynebacterium diphtheriae]MBG9357132.1 Cof-type HAD-IIB family hydrolase [Corynebacterium diphtheriae bv. mitis]CAB0498925.1 Cof-type HAD-IIB family hydrolase [Corynebacterium diphtheriae]CAB0500494.1 Cof-type HAD-IIB family hydrolase [Corynebacterium diphtheriae]